MTHFFKFELNLKIIKQVMIDFDFNEFGFLLFLLKYVRKKNFDAQM